MNNKIWWQNMTWEELASKVEESQRTAILPIGSTEQHGTHLPVGTDTMVAMTLAEDVAAKTNTVVAPPLWFGWSPHHMVLPGTITIRPEILIELTYDVLDSLEQQGFENVVLLNGHRIVNITWLQIVAERAKRQLGLRVVIFDPAYMSKEISTELGWGEIGHADEIESSQMMHKYPELVHMERAKDNPHQHADRYHVDPKYKGDTLCYVPSSAKELEASAKASGGTTGEPTKSSKEGGKKYHEHLVLRLEEVIGDIRRRS